MKNTSCLALLLVLSLACGASEWDRAVADANDAGQPLVIEFYADWCQPCKWFEANVLPKAAVATELQSVTFRRIDFDSEEGKHHARRFGINGVPSFLAVNSSGDVIGGLRGAAGESRFIEFLRWVRSQSR